VISICAGFIASILVAFGKKKDIIQEIIPFLVEIGIK